AVPNRCGAVINRPLLAVLGDEDRMVRQPDDMAFGDDLGDGVFHGLPGLFVDDVEDRWKRMTRRLLARPPCQRFGDGVEQGHSSFGVGRDDRISDAGERDPQLLPLALDYLGVFLRCPACRILSEQAACVLFGLLSFGHVSRDLAKASEFSTFIPQCGDDDAGPKPRPVLADSPPLLLVPALGSGYLQFLLGLAGLNILSRVEA